MRVFLPFALAVLHFVSGCSGDSADPSSSPGDGGGSSTGGLDGASSGGQSGGGQSGGAESGGGQSGGAESGGGQSGGAESGGAESGGAESGGAESGGAESGSGTGGTGAAAGGESTGGQASGGSSGNAGEYPAPDCGAPAELGVRIVGRHDGCTAGAVRFSWSGSGFIARFSGTGLSFTHSGGPIQYTVVVDGQVQTDIETASAESTYEAATGLEAGEHTVEIYRRGEASFGVGTLHSVGAVGGDLLAPPPEPARRIEIFGDSITCGYGNEGTTATCPFSADTENHYLTYGALLARHFEADLSTVAWSGKGVVVNYGGDMSTTLVEMLDRAVPNSDTSVWDYRLAGAPDLVMINLGTNDYSTDNDPTDATFGQTYEQMLTTLRLRYPDALILCTLGPLLSGNDLAVARGNITAAVTARSNAGDNRVQVHELVAGNPNPGCDYHPSLATHQVMADELSPVIASALGW